MKPTAENPTIRIKPGSKAAIRDLTIQQSKFLDDVNAAYAALRKDRKAWKEELAERALWDKTLADGRERE